MMLKKYSNKLVALHWMTVPLIIFSLVMGTFFCTISAVTLMILEVLQKLVPNRLNTAGRTIFLRYSYSRSGFSFIPKLH